MKDTKIQWCHHTFNPWIGCTNVSPGCKNCYAEADMDHRRHMAKWGDSGTRHVTSDIYWKQPLKWDREARKAGERRRVFCASLADVFEDRDELVPVRRRLARLIWETQSLDYLFLTKRIEHARRMIYEMWAPDAEWPRNYWLGTSVEDQQRADERIPILCEIPAVVRFISFEPLLGPIETLPDPHNLYGRIHWAIVGGESGPNARPCDITWIRSIRDQCRDAGVACFVKQVGSDPRFRGGIESGSCMPIGDPKGGDPDEWPKDLHVREFPTLEIAV